MDGPLVCSHMGDVGDLIAGMACFPQLGCVDLVLYPAPGRVREPFTPSKVEKLAPLLRLQDYISDVRFSDKPEGKILDGWRGQNKGWTNLADIMANFLGLPHAHRESPWLEVDQPEHVAPVVIHRSQRYHWHSRFPWKKLIDHFKDQIIMVGTEEEHKEFCNEFGNVNYYYTETYLDLARVIAGCSMFVGNQSSPYWIATGLMVPTCLEQSNNRQGNCHWERKNAIHDDIKLEL